MTHSLTKKYLSMFPGLVACAYFNRLKKNLHIRRGDVHVVFCHFDVGIKRGKKKKGEKITLAFHTMFL